MSKTKTQKAAEITFKESLNYYHDDVVFTEDQLKVVKKICLEMYDEGRSDGLNYAEDLTYVVIEKLNK